MRFLFLLLVPVLLALTSPNVHSTEIAYVTNKNDNTVSVIDIASREVIATIQVGQSPDQVAFTPDGTKAYVSNSGNDFVSVIDVATNTVIETITVGTIPLGVDVSPDGSIAYVVAGGQITVIDVLTDTVIGTISAGIIPLYVVFNPSGEYAYVTDSDGFLRVIDVAAGMDIFNINTPGVEPFYLDITPNGTTIFLSNSGGNIFVYDVSTTPDAPDFVDIINTPFFSDFIAFSPDSSIAYVTNTNNSVNIIDVDTLEIIETIQNAGNLGVAFTTDGQEAIALKGFLQDEVSVINVENSEVVANIQVGNNPFLLDITDFPSFSGIRRTNRFAMQMEFFDQLIWPPSLNPAIVSYRILEGQTVLGEVSASDPLVFLARNRPKTLPVTYTLQALDEDGNVIATLTATIP
jgi:YVTN family beta-propeller protein